jgi:hypothetical protein
MPGIDFSFDDNDFGGEKCKTLPVIGISESIL